MRNRLGLWACEACSRAIELPRSVFDLRADRDPLEARLIADTAVERAMLRALASLELGTDWKSSLEELLLELPDDAAGELMLILREGRGAFAPLLAGRGGTALFLGDPCSGTVVALARHGYAVTSLDSDLERLAFANFRNTALAPAQSARAVLHAPSEELPFRDQSFDLVVRETRFRRTTDIDLAECRRVCSGELLATGDNRLGYKESEGHHGAFRVKSPLNWMRTALLSKDLTTVERLTRQVVGPLDNFEERHSLALYPHSRDFTHIAALKPGSPQLYLGPKERKNALKLWAYRAGLFPLLTPSFAILASRKGHSNLKPRIQRVLAELAERLYEPCPEVEHLLATRGNNALVMTAPTAENQRDQRSRWILRIPLHPTLEERVLAEQSMLLRIERDFPEFPIPKPLLAGRFDDLFLTCERRLPGQSAAQHSGEPDAMARMQQEAAQHLAGLVTTPSTEITESDFERLVSFKYELVARHSGCPDARKALDGMHAVAREHLIGRRMPRVLRHCDPRSKHIQIAPNGQIHGFYDWGSAEENDFPLADLLHLIVHERFHQGLPNAGAAWQLIRAGGAGLRPSERAAIDTYVEELGIESDVRFAIEEIYPLLVGAMAEKNWDYSRPRWLQRSFGLIDN